jgi:large subunit ribosomal protein L21
MTDFAIIKTGGKQYRVSPGTVLRVEKLEGNAGDAVSLSDVLLTAKEGTVSIGMPLVETPVTATIVRQMRDEKKIIFRYHSKTRYRKLKGHRQHLTELEIKTI